MLLRVLLLVLYISMVWGSVIAEQSQEVTREGKGLTWDFLKIFDPLYINKNADAAEDPVEEYRGGNLTITGSGGRFFNPQWDAAEGRQSPRLLDKYYTVTMRPEPDVVSIEFTINSLFMQPPIDGDCINDKLEIFDRNNKLVIQDNLCGVLSNQYFYFPNDDGPFEILLKVLPRCQGGSTRFGRQYANRPTWDVKIEYVTDNYRGNNGDNIPSSSPSPSPPGSPFPRNRDQNRRLAAPYHHCLQYHTATSGTIKSFNYGGDMLNNMDYSICFGYEVGRHCGVEFTFSKLDLGNFKDRPLDALLRIAYGTRDTRGCMTTTTRRRPPPNNNGTCEHDYLLIGGERHCGDYTDYHVTAYGRSPTVVNVVSGMSNRFGEKGFYANYRMLGC